jgi:hypothetical protein
MISRLRRLALVLAVAGMVGLVGACNQGGGGGSVAPGGSTPSQSQSAPGGY